MSFKGEVRAALGWNWTDGAADDGRLDYAEPLLEGNGDNQAEAAWREDDATLTDGASTALDLTALTRTVLGDVNTVTFLTVKAVLIVNQSAGGGELVVGDAATDPWFEPFGSAGDEISVPPDSPLLLVNRGEGWPVDDSNKNLKLAAAGDEVTYSIAIVGTTTAAGSGSGSGSGG